VKSEAVQVSIPIADPVPAQKEPSDSEHSVVMQPRLAVGSLDEPMALPTKLRSKTEMAEFIIHNVCGRISLIEQAMKSWRNEESEKLQKVKSRLLKLEKENHNEFDNLIAVQRNRKTSLADSSLEQKLL
jgi:hypothetical protein